MSKIVVISLCYDNRDLPQIANQGQYQWNNDGWISHFCDGLHDLGHEVIAFPDVRYDYMLGQDVTNTDFYHLMMGFKPDVLITYKADKIKYSTMLDVFNKLPNMQKIWWSVDDPYLIHYNLNNEMAMKIRQHDLALTCCESSIDFYNKMGLDAQIFYPTVDPKVQNTKEKLGYELSEEEKERYSCDILMAGTCYNESHNSRSKICQKIIEAGLGDGLKIFGHSHWNDMSHTGFDFSSYYQGRIPESDMPKLYHNSKIVLNSWVNGGWPSGEEKCGYATKGYYNWRYFEIMGSGAFELCEYQQSDKNWPYKTGIHLETWKNIDELLEKIKYYLEHEEERKKIAKNGYNLTQQNFTFKKTLELIFGKA